MDGARADDPDRDVDATAHQDQKRHQPTTTQGICIIMWDLLDLGSSVRPGTPANPYEVVMVVDFILG